MKLTTLVILLSALAPAQSLVEHSAAAAGGAVGGVAGKKVSDGVTSIFGKIDKAVGKAAATDTPSKSVHTPAAKEPPNAPAFEVGPGVPHARRSRSSARASAHNAVPSVPPPPPIAHRTSHRAAPAIEEPRPMPTPVVSAPPPPPPQATRQDVQKISVGETRAQIEKLGFPAVHITMYDNGHLQEEFRFVNHNRDIGTVKLTDGAVSGVQVN